MVRLSVATEAVREEAKAIIIIYRGAVGVRIYAAPLAWPWCAQADNNPLFSIKK